MAGVINSNQSKFSPRKQTTKMEVADVKVKGRFAIINDAEMKVIMEHVDARNTNRVTATAVKLFREYLESKGKSGDLKNSSARS